MKLATKYPILLVHGIMLKDYKQFKAFGKIEKKLREGGYDVSTSRTDGLGTIQANAACLKEQIGEILDRTGVEKINLIAHSKGGLNARYMIDQLGMEEKVASVTFLCTPHKGSRIASKLYGLPRILRSPLVFWLNFWYRVFGDRSPDALEVCRQLRHTPDGVLEEPKGENGIFMQSYSTTLRRSRDDFVMGIPLIFSRYFEKDTSDGMVSAESSKFAQYRGDCTDESVSHSEIVDFMARKKKREKIYAFYIALCRDLEERGL